MTNGRPNQKSVECVFARTGFFSNPILVLAVALGSALGANAAETYPPRAEQPPATQSVASQFLAGEQAAAPTDSKKQPTADRPLLPGQQAIVGLDSPLFAGPRAWTSPEGLGSSLQVVLLLTVLSLAPAVLLMTTCYVRVVVVLSMLRQAIGTQNLPPTQVITTLALFVTHLAMTPTWKQVYEEAIVPYTQRQIGPADAWNAGATPIRRFMSLQIENAKNTDDVWLFMSYLPGKPEPKSYDDVPLQALLPAFMLSELKMAFLIGFQIYLPFIILDMVVASVMVSMGMLMLPPAMISLPLKILLFVLVDGWRLVVGMLLQSFQAVT